MNRQDYEQWWIDNDREDVGHPEPMATLTRHVLALQERIDKLTGGTGCACAYDHPDDVCMAHQKNPGAVVAEIP